MTVVDNSKIFLEGVYSDENVTIPAETTYKKGTVLGRNKDGELVAFSTDNNVAATSDKAAFTTEPLCILAQTITNDSEDDAETVLARVFECGAVDKNKLIFEKADDAKDVNVLDALKRNGYSLELVEELTERSSLAE